MTRSQVKRIRPRLISDTIILPIEAYLLVRLRRHARAAARVYLSSVPNYKYYRLRGEVIRHGQCAAPRGAFTYRRGEQTRRRRVASRGILTI